MDIQNVDLLFDRNPNPMWVYDPKTLDIVEANKSAVEYYGYSRDELLSMTIKDLRPESEVQRLIEHVNEYEGGLKNSEIWKHKAKSGKIIYARVNTHQIKYSGNIYRLVSAQDVTEQEQLKHNLNQERELFTIITESLPGTFFLFNKEGQILRWNRQLEMLTGYSSKEVLTKPILDYFEEGERDRILYAVNEAFEKGSVEIESEIIKKNGDKLPMLFNAKTTTYLEEECVVGIGIDISSLKKVLREKELLLREVHHRVKNNLAVVKGLLQLQEYEATDCELIEVLKESRLRINTIAHAHELLYQNKSLTDIHFDKHLKHLLSHIKDLYNYNNGQDIRLEAQNIELNINQAIPLSLLVDELFMSLHRKTCKQSGNVDIMLNQYNDIIQLKFVFDGEFKEGKTLNDELIEALIQQLDATTNWTKNKWTEFTIHFKKRDVKGSSTAFLR